MASRRGYLSQAELSQYADITIVDGTEADDQISQAEEIIDAYVGPQYKFYPHILQGKVSVGGSTTVFTLDTIHNASFPFTNYLKGCYVEILGGSGIGERKLITGSATGGIITTEAFTATLDTTSFYKIYQPGKFPRINDVIGNTYETPIQYYKSIPEAIKRATAAQVEYVVNMGTKYFNTDASERASETIGDYSYSKGRRPEGSNALIAPKARMLLKGITNRTGQIINDY